MGFSTLALLLTSTYIKTGKVLVALFVKISCNAPNGKEVVSKQLMYCLEGLDSIHNIQCSIQLGILDPNFSRI